MKMVVESHHTRRLRILLVGNSKSIFGFAQLARVSNLGLCSIAASIDPTAFDVRTVNLILKGDRAGPYFERILHSFQPDIIGISCTVFQYNDAVELARQVKMWNPQAKTVIGGFIHGYPDDTEETFWSTLEYALSISATGRNSGSLAPHLRTQ
jgi:hypothetical protein